MGSNAHHCWETVTLGTDDKKATHSPGKRPIKARVFINITLHLNKHSIGSRGVSLCEVLSF